MSILPEPSSAMTAFESELNSLLKIQKSRPVLPTRTIMLEEYSDSSQEGTYDGSPSPPPPDLSKIPRRKRKRLDTEEIPKYDPRRSNLPDEIPEYGPRRSNLPEEIPEYGPRRSTFSPTSIDSEKTDNKVLQQLIGEMIFDPVLNEYRPVNVPLCKFFRTGICRDGVHCSYWHNHNSEKQRQEEARRLGMPIRKSRRFRSYNSCLARLVQHSALNEQRS